MRKIVKLAVWGEILFIFSLSLVTFFWAGPKEIIDSNDTIYPLRPIAFFNERLYQWNHSLGAGADFSYGSAGLTWHGLQALLERTGVSIYLNQKIFLFLLFNLISFSFYFFIRLLLPENRLARLAGVVFYSFNPYLFNLWENIQSANLTAYAFIPLWSAFFLKAFAEPKKVWFWAVLAGLSSVILSAFGMNPQVALVVWLYFFLFLGFIFWEKVIKTKSLRLIVFGRVLFLFALFYFILNSFWLIPELNSVVGGGLSLAIPSAGKLRGWLDFLSGSTSALNVIRFQGEWTWRADFKGEARIPFAHYYRENPLLVVLSLLPFLFSAIALVKSKNKWRLFFGLVVALGLLASIGTKPPFGYLYLFITEKIKFLSFFRSPWYKFSLLTAIGYSVLISFFAAWCRANLRLKTWLSLALIAFPLIYSYPLLTGEAFPINFQKLTPYLFTIPEYVWQADEWLRNDPEEGKAVMLPRQGDLDYYRWGYGASYQILNLLGNPKPILTEPSWTVMSGTEANRLVGLFYDCLYRGFTDEAVKILSPLNVKYLIQKNDFYDDYDWEVGRPDFLGQRLAGEKYLKKVEKFGEWDIYELDKEVRQPFIYGTNEISFLEGDISTLANVSFLSEDSSSASLFSSPKTGSLGKSFRENYFTSGFLLEKIPNYTPPPAYIRFAPTHPLYGYIRKKETASLQGLNSVQKLSLLAFYGTKRVLELEKIRPEKTDLAEAKVLEDYLETLTNINDLIDELRPKFGRETVESFQAVDRYLSDQEKRLIGSDEKIKKILAEIGLARQKIKETFEEYLSSETTRRFEVGVSREGEYEVYLLDETLSRQSALKNFSLELEINGKKQSFTASFQKNGWLLIKDVFFPAGRSRFSFAAKSETFPPQAVLKLETSAEPLPKAPEIHFQKVNPTKYLVDVKGAAGDFLLVMAENFHPGWQAMIKLKNGGKITLPKEKHLRVNGFGMGWLIDQKGDYQVILEYLPQRIYQGLLWFSFVSFILGGIFVIIKLVSKDEKKT